MPLKNFMEVFARKAAVPESAPSPSRVLVAGASGAIGSAIAHAFAADGARLALHYHRNAAAVQTLCGDIAACTQRLPAMVDGDLTDADAARKVMRDAATALGGLDAVVACVGSANDQPLVMIESAELRATLRGNLAPVVNLCEAFRELRGGEPGGAIVIVSSITGLVGQPMRTVYAAAKAAVISYSKWFARDVAAQGMTVNCVAPQVVEGGLADRMKQRMREVLLANTPLARTCEADDIAGATVFLASRRARFITGTALNLTGGLVTW